MDEIVRRFATFAHTLTYDDLPEDVVTLVEQHLLDSLACGVGGRDFDVVRAAFDWAPEVKDGHGTGRALTYGRTLSEDNAAFVNTAMIRYLDFNDTYTGGHPSDAVGALLAHAGAHPTTGQNLITALVVAYEVYNRLSDSTRLRERGWDQGAHVAVAVAAGLGNLRGLEFEQIAQAVALATAAVSPMRSTRAGQLSPWKGAATAQASREGTFLTALAQAGVEGPEAPYEGRHGVQDLITGPLTIVPFPTEPEGEYLFPFVALKYWPVEYNTQLAVWMAKSVAESVDSLDDLDKVVLSTYWCAWHETGSEPEKWRPTSRETADHSMPYIFAHSLLNGSIDINAFEPEAFTSSDVLEMMTRVEVNEDQELQDLWNAVPRIYAMRAVATTKDGSEKQFSLQHPRGHWGDRMNSDESAAKFRNMAQALGAERVEAALEFWTRLRSQEDVRPGFDLLEISDRPGLTS